jgi:hypothetical protein
VPPLCWAIEEGDQGGQDRGFPNGGPGPLALEHSADQQDAAGEHEGAQEDQPVPSDCDVELVAVSDSDDGAAVTGVGWDADMLIH